MITEKQIEEMMNPEEAKEYIELTKKVLAGMLKEQAEQAAVREKYAKESDKPIVFGKYERNYRLDLRLRGQEAIAVIKLLESFDKLKDKTTSEEKSS